MRVVLAVLGGLLVSTGCLSTPSPEGGNVSLTSTPVLTVDIDASPSTDADYPSSNYFIYTFSSRYAQVPAHTYLNLTLGDSDTVEVRLERGGRWEEGNVLRVELTWGEGLDLVTGNITYEGEIPRSGIELRATLRARASGDWPVVTEITPRDWPRAERDHRITYTVT